MPTHIFSAEGIGKAVPSSTATRFLPVEEGFGLIVILHSDGMYKFVALPGRLEVYKYNKESVVDG